MPLYHPAVLSPRERARIEEIKKRMQYADHTMTEDQKICKQWHERNTDRQLANIDLAHQQMAYEREIEAVKQVLVQRGIDPEPEPPKPEPVPEPPKKTGGKPRFRYEE